MNILVLFCAVIVLTLNIVRSEDAPDVDVSIRIDEILRKITSGLLNSRNGNPDGFYEVGDDGGIHFVHNDDSKDSTTISSTAVPSITTTTPEPNLADDESDSDLEEEQSYDPLDDTLWEFIPKQIEVHDPLKDSDAFPLIDTNEVEHDNENDKTNVLQRTKRGVNVNVGGQGGGSSGGVDVAVNKPGGNVNVNVGGIEDFLGQFGVYFKKQAGAGGHAGGFSSGSYAGGSSSGSYAGGSGSGSYGGSAVDVNVNKGGHGSNVDVNVGGNSGKPVYVNVDKHNKHGAGGGQTAVAVDWSSFIPFVNVGVNKGDGGKKVDVNVGQNGGHPGGSFVDVNVNKGHNKPKDIKPHDNFENDDKYVDVDLRSSFVDVNVDAEHSGDVHPHKPPKKHHKPHHSHHDDEDKNVSVNVGGQGGANWWPFVNVNVDKNVNVAGKSAGPRKCININVPFVNVLLNRGCKGSGSEIGEGSYSSASASASSSYSSA